MHTLEFRRIKVLGKPYVVMDEVVLGSQTYLALSSEADFEAVLRALAADIDPTPILIWGEEGATSILPVPKERIELLDRILIGRAAELLASA